MLVRNLQAALRTGITDADALHIAILGDPSQHLVHSDGMPFPDVFLHLQPIGESLSPMLLWLLVVLLK